MPQLPSSGALSFNDIQTEFGGSNPISLNEYYAGGSLIPSGFTGDNGAVPSSGQISMSQFRGLPVTPSYGFYENTQGYLIYPHSVLGYDRKRNVYMGTVTFGNTIIISKVDHAGNFVWRREFASDQSVFTSFTFQENSYGGYKGIRGCVDPVDGTVFLAVTMNISSYSPYFGPGVSDARLAILKINTDGNLVTAVFDSANNLNAYNPIAMTLGRDGFIYVVTDELFTGYSAFRVYKFAKASLTVQAASMVRWISGPMTLANNIDVDSSGNVYVVSSWLASTSSPSTYLFKLTSNLTSLAAPKRFGANISAGRFSHGNLVTDDSGNVYLVGIDISTYSSETNYTNATRVVKLNSSFIVQWAKNLNVQYSTFDYPNLSFTNHKSVAIDTEGNIWVGSIARFLNSGTYTNPFDAHAFKYTPSGTLLFTRKVSAPVSNTSRNGGIYRIVAMDKHVFLQTHSTYTQFGIPLVWKAKIDGSQTNTYPAGPLYGQILYETVSSVTDQNFTIDNDTEMGPALTTNRTSSFTSLGGISSANNSYGLVTVVI